MLLNQCLFVLLPNEIKLIMSIKFDWFNQVRKSNGEFDNQTHRKVPDYTGLLNQSKSNWTIGV